MWLLKHSKPTNKKDTSCLEQRECRFGNLQQQTKNYNRKTLLLGGQGENLRRASNLKDTNCYVCENFLRETRLRRAKLWKEGKVLCKADKYVTIKYDKMKSKMKQKKPKWLLVWLKKAFQILKIWEFKFWEFDFKPVRQIRSTPNKF